MEVKAETLIEEIKRQRNEALDENAVLRALIAQSNEGGDSPPPPAE